VELREERGFDVLYIDANLRQLGREHALCVDANLRQLGG
jgi:hypothetical protein